jgi:CRP-like cAMP-binding protein
LTPAEEDLIRQLFVPETVPKGAFFLAPGEVSRKIGFVLQGVLHKFQTRNDQKLTYYFGREQEFIGDYESFLPAQPAIHGIQALEETRLLTISQDNLQRLYQEVREGERFGGRGGGAGCGLGGRPGKGYKDTPAQRYARFVSTYPDLQQRISQYHIASYVGVKPQSLSRIRGRAAS